MARERAFTLIELLVVIAVIAVLIGMLLPALGRSRAAGQRIASLQNLRSNGTYAGGYASSNKDAFVNPFSPIPTFPRSRPDAFYIPWVWLQNVEYYFGDPTPRGWAYGPPYSQSGSESYGYHWIAHTLFDDNDAGSRSKSNVAPADKALQNWLRTNTDANAQSDLTWIFPSSYWYPPVFWQKPEHFILGTRDPGASANRFHVRRNLIGECTYPSRKVLLTEAKDFVQAGQPMWNSFRAKPQVLLVDGSGRTLDMATIYGDTAIGAPTPPDKLPAPSGLWNPTEREMSSRMMFGKIQGFDWDYTNPAFFWATHDGIRGRDFK